MSISASIIRTLIAGGKQGADMIVVAEAMERGPDASVIYTLIEAMTKAGATETVVAIAIVGVAEEINARNSRASYRYRAPRDEHTEQKDSNRSRRNMRDSEWRELRIRIFQRDGYECRYCGSCDDLTCDHIVPLVRGGTNDHENLATACRSCNSSKGDKMLDDWRVLA